MTLLNKVKMKMLMELLNELAPNMEIKFIKNAKIDGKTGWHGMLMREKVVEAKKADKKDECSGDKD